jgi:hypothetical protein
MTEQLGTLREGVMSTVASLPSVMKPRYIEPVGERTKLKKVMLASFVTLWTRAPNKLLFGMSSPSSNVKPAHNTNKYFAPNLRWGCQSHWFAVNKGLSVSSGKRIIVMQVK